MPASRGLAPALAATDSGDMGGRTPAALRTIGALLLLGFMLIAATPASGGASAKYQWAIVDEQLQATTDGGHHWRVIFAPEGPVWHEDQIGRVSGFVSEGDPFDSDTFWTADNGRHWFYAPDIRLDAGGFAGQGRLVFWSHTSGGSNGGLPEHNTFSLYQVAWPPTAANRVCLEGRGPEGYCASRRPLKSTRVARVADRFLAPGALENVPGGVAALLERLPGQTDSPQFELLLRLYGKTESYALPDASPAAQAATSGRGVSFVVSWPTMVVIASNPAKHVLVVWQSPDGGETWELDEEP